MISGCTPLCDHVTTLYDSHLTTELADITTGVNISIPFRHGKCMGLGTVASHQALPLKQNFKILVL